MQRSDYILRMIEQLGQMLIQVRKLIIGGSASAEQVQRDLHGVAAAGNIDLDIARLATPDTLLMLVAPSGEVEPTRCWLYAELLYLDGLEAAADRRADDARLSFDKAVRLFALLEPGGVNLVGWPDAADRILEIHAALESLDAASDTGVTGPS
jgi:hypothetical protein